MGWKVFIFLLINTTIIDCRSDYELLKNLIKEVGEHDLDDICGILFDGQPIFTDPIRKKRYTDDQLDIEVKLPIGLSFGLKYSDPNRPSDGVMGFIDIDSIKLFHPGSPVDKIRLVLNYKNQGNGHLEWTFQYIINSLYTGSLEIKREHNRGVSFWKISTKIKKSSTLNIIVKLSKTKLEFTLKKGNFLADFTVSMYDELLKTFRYEGNINGKVFSGFWKLYSELKHNFELELGNKPIVQLSTEEPKKSSSVGKFSINGGRTAKGKFRWRYIPNGIQIQVKDKGVSNEVHEITVLNDGESVSIKNEIKRGEIIWIYKKEKINSTDLITSFQPSRVMNDKLFPISKETHIHIDVNKKISMPKTFQLHLKYKFDSEPVPIFPYINLDTTMLPYFSFEAGITDKSKRGSEPKKYSLGLKAVDNHGAYEVSPYIVNINETWSTLIRSQKHSSSDEHYSSKFIYLPEDKKSPSIEIRYLNDGSRKLYIDGQVCQKNQRSKKLSSNDPCQKAWMYDIESDSILDNNKEFEVSLKDGLEFNSSFYSGQPVGKQKIDLAINHNKQSNKIVATWDVEQNDQGVAHFFLDTRKQPYKYNFKSKDVLKMYNIIGVNIIHMEGQSLEIQTKFPFFRSFKIVRTGDGNGRELFLNGKQLKVTQVKGDKKLEVIEKKMLSNCNKLSAILTEVYTDLENVPAEVPRILVEALKWMLMIFDITKEDSVRIMATFYKAKFKDPEFHLLTLVFLPVSFILNIPISPLIL